MRELLTRQLVRDLDGSGVCPPGKAREIAQRLVALAMMSAILPSSLFTYSSPPIKPSSLSVCEDDSAEGTALDHLADPYSADQ